MAQRMLMHAFRKFNVTVNQITYAGVYPADFDYVWRMLRGRNIWQHIMATIIHTGAMSYEAEL